jgi:hypothetical protein
MGGNFKKVMRLLESLYNELEDDSSVSLDDCADDDVQDFVKLASCTIAQIGNAIHNALVDGRFAVGINGEYVEKPAATAR